MHKTLFAAVLLTLLCFSLLPDPAVAQGRTVVVGIPYGGWPPYAMERPQPRSGFQGVMLDVMGQALHHMGYFMNIRAYPNKRAMVLLSEGRLNAYPKAMKWVAHPERYYWSDPVVESEDILVGRAGTSQELTSLKDLRGKRLGVVYGFGYPRLDPLMASGMVKRNATHTTTQLLELLQAGFVDAVAINGLVARWIITHDSRMKLSDFRFYDMEVGRALFRFAFTHDDLGRELRDGFNRVLADMQRDGTLKKILARYQAGD